MNGRPVILPIPKFHYDPVLVMVTACLLFMGFVMVASSSLHLGVEQEKGLFLLSDKAISPYCLGVSLRIWYFQSTDDALGKTGF